MDFSFTEEQTLLRNSVAKYLADNYTFEKWRKFTRAEPGRDADQLEAVRGAWAFWRQACRKIIGGLGGNAVDNMVVMEEFGKALVVEPYVPTVVIGGGLIARNGSKELKDEVLPKIAGGETMIAFAFAEPQGPLQSRRHLHHGEEAGFGLRAERP